MFNKNKRVLWLLNHRTLMPFEAPLIQRLGFEIYIPKVIPKTNFRSAAIDFSFDESLSIPRAVLDRLNKFNFYEDVWPTDIVKIVNRYFGTVFIIPHARQVTEALKNFEGQIVFRAFGLDNGQSYRLVLENLYDPLVLRMIKGIKERFWFGEGYDNLHECEDPVFAERALYLPIGVPKSFFANANRWSGKEAKILFVCPHVVSNPYYRAIYQEFKEAFGDLPHVIIGAQDGPVADPHVAGFVSDEDLNRLYLECAVLYYHSTEMRHVHYSPIEASINGMPIVFHKGSLLDRLSGSRTKGSVATVEEARSLIERILAGDNALIEEIRTDQQRIAHHFSDGYCTATWQRNMEQRGFFRELKADSRWSTLLTEGRRELMLPLAGGRTTIHPQRKILTPASAKLSARQAVDQFGSSIYEGIQFGEAQYPEMVDYVSGVGASEGWGRWSTGDKIVIVLKHLLEGKFRLFVSAVGYEKNAGAAIPVRVGSQVRSMRLAKELAGDTGAWLHFDLPAPSNVIEIAVPFPSRPPMDARMLGIGLAGLRAAPFVVMSAAEASHAFGASMEDGIDFSRPALPAFVDSISGVFANETWGRWSTGERVAIELKHVLQGKFRLLFRAVGYGPNIDAPIAVQVGAQRRMLKLPARIGSEDEFAVEFDLRTASNTIEIDVPFPICPPDDGRALGIGFYRIRVETLANS